MNWEDLSGLTEQELNKMNMIAVLRKMDEETRLMRERHEQERERYEKEREERAVEREKEREERAAEREKERERYEKEMALRRERHEHEIEKMRNESRKVRMDWLLAPILAAVAASSATVAALKWLG